MLHRTGWILALSLIIAGCDTVDSVVDRVAGMWRDSPAPAPEQVDRASPAQTDGGRAEGAGPEGEAHATASTEPAEGDADRDAGGAPGDREPSARATVDGPRTEADGTVLPTGRLFTVQVAAFQHPDTAAALSDRLAGRGLPVWVTESTQGGRTYYRVRVGAAPRLGEIRRLGERIQTELRLPVWIAPVEPTTRIPTDLVRRTREHLGGT